MYNPIILSASLFGSFYLLSQSLEFINRSQLENKPMSHELLIINIFTMSGSMVTILYGITMLQ